MKSVKNIVIALALVIVNSHLVAGNGGSSNINSVMNSVKENISFSSNKSGEAKKVTFTFTVDEIGKVNAVSAKVENKQERAALEAQFTKLTFAKLAQGVTYSIDVNFINY
jgi:hypothetical protein